MLCVYVDMSVACCSEREYASICLRTIKGFRVSRYNVAVAMEPLLNLSEQSARIGMWRLSVATDPRTEEYTYGRLPDPRSGKGKGKKFECLLVSDDSDAYCMGQFKRKGKEPAATTDFQVAIEKFKKGSVWIVKKKYRWLRATVSI